ncbi:YfdQ family protein, partial [Morganella morganii]|uniref:YfdQ family protein n=1 Tax=Morganella morganii TaxID=582 RepID=UPI0005FB49A4
MSNLDGTAISQIKNMAVAALSLDAVEKSLCPAVILPGDFNVKSLEHLQEGRYRFRGAMDTTSIADFVKYSLQHGIEDGVSCFIDADEMAAKTIFNIGTIGDPGHADNTATVSLKKTSPFASLLNVNGRRQGQKELAEWLEDWRDNLMAFDAEGNVIDIKQAINAVRKITIEASRSADHEDRDFGASRSVMESVEAKSRDIMPAVFQFTCTPYDELSERAIKLRYSVLTGGDVPVLVLRIVQLEN